MRCPLVPAPTGKFTICAAKMKTATRPAMGAAASANSRLARRSDTATAPPASSAAAADVWTSMKPSGMCMPIIIANDSQ